MGLMLGFCLALGLQQVAIKAVADAIAPLAQIAIRSTIAGILVLGVARYRGIRLYVVEQSVPGIVVGLGFTLEFAFVAIGLNYTLASHMSVFLYTAPVFAAIGLHLFVPDEQLAMRHWTGVIAAFVGLAIAMVPHAGMNGDILLGDGFGVLAGACWAATTLVVRTSSLSEAPPLRTLGFQLAIASVVLLTTAGVNGQLTSIHMTPLAWLSMTFQTLVVAFGALLLWFWLLRRYLASRIGVFAFASPMFGVAFGALLLGDPLSLNFLLGGFAIVLGMILVNTPPPVRRARD